MQNRNPMSKDRHGRGGKGSPDRTRGTGENRGNGRDNRGNSRRESDDNR
jgi:hypothetical protein